MKKMGIILAISFSLCLIFFGVFMIVKEQDRLNKEIKKKEIKIKQEKEKKKKEEKVENQTEKETKTEEPTQNTTQDEKTDIENAIDNYQHHINLEYFINSDMETTIKKEFSENNHNYTVESTADVVRIMVDNILIYERKHNETINSLENFTIYYMDIINDLIVFTSHIGTNITGFSITGLTLTGKEVFHYSNNIDPNIDSVRINSQKYSIDKNTNNNFM